MLIIGAKGFAKEVLEILHQNNDLQHLAFYDDVNDDVNGLLYNQFPVLKSLEEVENYFLKVDKRFTIGIGNPKLRAMLHEKFIKLGGELTSVISSKSEIGSYGVEIGEGCVIMGGVRISNDVKIGKGTMVYYNSVITHDVSIGDFVEISPAVNLLGRCNIGSFTALGSNSTLLPDVNIGKNVIVGAGSVVTKDLPDNCTAVGIPAKVIKHG